jgi:hypothetical protein
MDVLRFFIVCVCVCRVAAFLRAVPSFRGVLSVASEYMCLTVFDPETSRTLRPTPELGCSATEELKESAMHAALYEKT